MLRAALRPDAVAEPLGRLAVDDAVPLEYAESIRVEHLSPFVAVISCGISSSHDMTELHRHACVLQLLRHHSLLPCLLLKRHDVLVKLVLQRVVCHVEQSEAHLPHASVCHVVVAALHYAVNQFVGQRFACLVVECECAQELFLHCVVLHKLRRQFHEIPSHVRSAQTLESRVGKHAVQRVSELVQESLHLSQCQQCRFVVGGLCEVHHHAHMRSHVHSLA